MPQPTGGDIHVDRALTDLSVLFVQDLDDYVADKIFPLVPSSQRSNRFYTYDRDDWFRVDSRLRAPGTESAGSGYSVDNTNSFFCDVHSFHKDVDDQDRANADAVLNLDRDATELVTRDLMLDKELDWAGTFFTTGVWTGSSTGTDVVPGTKWDVGGSTPIEDIRTELRSVKKQIGRRPNVVTMGEEVWDVLQDHPDFLNRVKITTDKIVTPDLFSRVLGVDRVLIAGAIQNTAPEGATISQSFVYGDSLLVVYAAPRPGILMPSGGYTFGWTGLVGSNQRAARIKNFRMEPLASDRIEGDMAYDQRLIADFAGAFLTDLLT